MLNPSAVLTKNRSTHKRHLEKIEEESDGRENENCSYWPQHSVLKHRLLDEVKNRQECCAAASSLFSSLQTQEQLRTY